MSQTELFDLRVAQEELFKLRHVTYCELKEATRNLELATLGREDMDALRQRAALSISNAADALNKLARSLGFRLFNLTAISDN